jgi:hypothetical protein
MEGREIRRPALLRVAVAYARSQGTEVIEGCLRERDPGVYIYTGSLATLSHATAGSTCSARIWRPSTSSMSKSCTISSCRPTRS